MTVAEHIAQILDTSAARTCAETHDPNQTPALAYAHSLWALEDDLRQLAARLGGTPL